MSVNSKFKVLHNVYSWLPQTQNWIFHQIRALNFLCSNYIGCNRLENLDQFSLPNIYCLRKCYPIRYVYDYILQIFKIRDYLSSSVCLAQKLQTDILHSHFGHWGWHNIEVAKRTGIKHVVTFYGFDVNMLPTKYPVWKNRYKELFQKTDLFLCEGPFMAQAIINLGCPPEKVKVNHIGIDTDKILFKPRSWQAGQPLRILIAASFKEKKGIPYALMALEKLQSDLSLEITIIGDADKEKRSQREKLRILETLKNSGLNPKTRLLGYQPHAVLFKEAYEHHIFLSPSVTAEDGDTEGGGTGESARNDGYWYACSEQPAL